MGAASSADQWTAEDDDNEHNAFLDRLGKMFFVSTDDNTTAAAEQNDGDDTLGDDHNAEQEENEAIDQTSRETELQWAGGITKLIEQYVQNCPALAEDDTEGYPSDQGELDREDDDVEDAAGILEEIQPYINMAVAAYSESSMRDTVDMVESSQIIRNVMDPTHLFGFGKTDTEVHVCILDDQSVVFAFRGTEPTDWKSGFGDVLTDLAEGQVPVKLYNGSGGPLYTSSALQVHSGFQAALKDVTDTDGRTEDLMLVLEGLGMDAGDVRRVVCVGHSLGGALATLCAKWCREVAFPGAEIGCVTIGSPRVGNMAFAADFKSKVVNGMSYRVVNKRDVVPCVPNLLSYPVKGSLYKHVLRPIYLYEDEAGTVRSRVGGMRPTWGNLGFSDHLTVSYTNSIEAVLA